MTVPARGTRPAAELAGKVALITGAARGMGRSHAVEMAREGADVIALDLCGPLPTVEYALSEPADLEETRRLVEETGSRCVTGVVDVRDAEQLAAAYRAARDELGVPDIVVANAGIAPLGGADPDPAATFRDVVDVNLVGVWNTVKAVAGDMIERGTGGSVVLISSTQGLTGRGGDGTAATTGYTASKHAVVGLMRSFANWLSPHGIRVNSVHPTGVATRMVQNEVLAGWLRAHPEKLSIAQNLMPVSLIDPVDVSNALVFLAGDRARYITGVMLPVDAGFSVR